MAHSRSFPLSLLALALLLLSLVFTAQAAPFNISTLASEQQNELSYSTLVALSVIADPPRHRAAEYVRANSVDPMSSAEVAKYVPYTRLASATYCPLAVTKTWTCGQHCDALPGMVIYDAGGNNQDIPYWYVGYLPSLASAVVAHRGTNTTALKSLLVDANYFLEDLDAKYFPNVDPGVQVHQGFAECHGKTASQINSAVQKILSDHPNSTVVTVGHSLGGALAALDALSLRQFLPSTTTLKVVTLGQPRVGNQEFADYFDAHFSDVSRLTHRDDVVPILPGRFLGFHHSSGEKHLDPSGDWWACKGQDNEANPQCSTGEVSNILDGNTTDHTGPYAGGISMGC